MSRVDAIQNLMESRFGDGSAGYPVWPQKLQVGAFLLMSNGLSQRSPMSCVQLLSAFFLVFICLPPVSPLGVWGYYEIFTTTLLELMKFDPVRHG
jgi:hypothetical protein